jgi:hypothetical protein
MNWNDTTLQLVTPAHTISFNAATGDAYLNDPLQCAGLGQAPLRVTVEDRPQTHGGILHPTFRGARHITIAGVLLVRSSGTDSGIVTAREGMIDDLVEALESIENADGTLSWASAAHTLAVRSEIPFDPSGAMEKTYTFGLIAPDPAIS